MRSKKHNPHRDSNWTALLPVFSCFALFSFFCANSFLRAADLARIETPFFRFSLFPDNGACEVLDKGTQVTWQCPTNHAHFGYITLSAHDQSRRLPLAACSVKSNGNELVASFRPSRLAPLAEVHVQMRALPDQRTLEVHYQEDNEVEVENVSMLEDLLGVTDSAQGYLVVPVREGLRIPANSGLSFSHRFDAYAYEGCHMAMLGAVQGGAAAMLTWDDPYVTVELKSSLTSLTNSAPEQSAKSTGAPAPTPTCQRLSLGLQLTKSARTFRIHFLGQGDYVDIAKAYRDVAQAKGWVVPWEQKLKETPERAKLFGAANIKLWSALDRRMNEESTKEESVRVNWTFDEAAQVAEHLKRDLKLDRVLFTIGGWIHRGYDNQHPDILPTAPECGGDSAFADCARRVRELGYLFCLHDNYQDIYRDSPSWNEDLVMKTEEHKLVAGGHWAGGRAYLTCSQASLDLARRPQNLPAVKKLSGANAYFIDTTYAAGLQECFDPAHPLTRADDMQRKQALSDYAREVFGVFGSECGREWAIPHSDFFEGLTGVSGQAYHDTKLLTKLGATVVPLFDLVYRDCIAMYGKYGYDTRRAAEYVLHHISLARPLNYHAIPPHLYWKQNAGPAATNGPAVDPALFTRADNGWGADFHPLDRFIKNTYEILSPLNELTARMPMTGHRFLTPDRTVQQTTFGEGPRAVSVLVNLGTNSYTLESKLGGHVELPAYGFLAESPSFIAFHALTWNGLRYESPALFSLRSLDDQPLSRTKKLRVFHAFGPEQLRLGSESRRVPREALFN
jgi:hypothetical protein